MRPGPHAHALRFLCLLALLLGPVLAAAAVAPAQASAILVGVRTNTDYLPIGSGCVECEPAVPAQEWFWLRILDDGPPRVVGVSIGYLQGSCMCRALDLQMITHRSVILIPAASTQEEAIVVRVHDDSGGPPVVSTFPVVGSMPPDPRQISLKPTDEWLRAGIQPVGSDLRALYVFGRPSLSEQGSRSASFFDLVYEEQGEGRWLGSHGAGNGAGAQRAGLSFGDSGLDVRPALLATPADMASHASVIATGKVLDNLSWDIGYGYVGPAERAEGILLFSLNDSFRVDMLGRGPVELGANAAQGARLSTTQLAAQHGVARAQARFAETASLVIASASRGGTGSGEVEIRHGANVMRETLSNGAPELALVSTGDCQGEWSVSSTGTSVQASRTTLLAAHGYHPSLPFREAYHSENGWCAPMDS